MEPLAGTESGSVAYVVAHGALEETAEQAWVPPKLRVVFHARPGAGLWTLAVARVLEILADQGQEEHVGQDNPPVWVPNYQLGGDTDLAIAVELQLAHPDLDRQLNPQGLQHLYFVGGDRLPRNPTHLCTDPGKQGACYQGRRHDCQGIFGVLGDHYGALHFISCRVVKGVEDPAVDWDVAGDDPAVLDAAYHRAMEFAEIIRVDTAGGWTITDDPAQLARARAYYEDLGLKGQARLLAGSAMAEAWYEIVVATDFRAHHGDWGFYVYYTTQSPQAQEYIRMSPALAPVLDDCEATLSEFDPTRPEDVASFDRLTGREQHWLSKVDGPVGTWAAERLAELQAVSPLDRARRMLSGSDTLASYLGLLDDEQAAAAAAADPQLATQVETVTTEAVQFLTWWADPATTNEQRIEAFEERSPAEQAALTHLIPDALEAMIASERPEGARPDE